MSYNRGGSYYSPRYGSSSSHNPSKKYDSHNDSTNANSTGQPPSTSAPSSSSTSSTTNNQSLSNPRRERDHYTGSAGSRYEGTMANNGKYNKYLPKNSNSNSSSDLTNQYSSSGSSKNNTSIPNNNSNPNTYYGSASSSNINNSSSNSIPKRRPNVDRYDSYTSASNGGKLYSSSVSSSEDRIHNSLHRSYSENSVNKDKKGSLSSGNRAASHHHSTHHSTSSTSSSRPTPAHTNSGSTKLPTSNITSASTGFRDDRRKSSSSSTPLAVSTSNKSSTTSTHNSGHHSHNQSHSHSHNHIHHGNLQHEDSDLRSKSSSTKPFSNNSSKPSSSNSSSRHSSIGIETPGTGMKRKSSFHDSKTVSPLTASGELNKDDPHAIKEEKQETIEPTQIKTEAKDEDPKDASKDVVKTSFAAYAKQQKQIKAQEVATKKDDVRISEPTSIDERAEDNENDGISIKEEDTSSVLSSLPIGEESHKLAENKVQHHKESSHMEVGAMEVGKSSNDEEKFEVSQAHSLENNSERVEDVEVPHTTVDINTSGKKLPTEEKDGDGDVTVADSTSEAVEESEISESNKSAITESNDKDKLKVDVIIQSIPASRDTATTSSSGDISTLSPVRDISSDDFNFNNLATIKEGEPVDNTSNILEDINEDEDEAEAETEDIDGHTQDSKASERNESIDEYDDEHELSEAETVISESPQKGIKGRRLIRKKEYDEERHNLKRKALYSSDEEMEDADDDDDDDADEDESEYQPSKGISGHGSNSKDNIDSKYSRANKMTNSYSEINSGDEVKPIYGKPYKIKRDAGGRSFLQRACKKGNFEEVRDYISRGASAKEKDFCGFTCLHEAALEGHTDIVKFLLDHGANVNAQADAAGDSDTALIDAAENKHFDTVKLLLEYGADPTIYNIDGFTALTKIFNEHAGESGYSEIIKLLENANAKFTQTQKREIAKAETPVPRTIVEDPNDNYFADLIKRKGIFKYAAEGSKEVTANHFVSGNSLSAKPDILILAARNGHAELVDIILGLNPTPYDIDTENDAGVTALLASVGRGHYDIVESLLSKDADPFKKRKQDNLNALEISERSVHFDASEIKLLQDYMNKKMASKSAEVSTIHSVVTSTVTSTVVSEDEDGSMTPLLSDKEPLRLAKTKSNDDKKRKSDLVHPKPLKKHKSEVKIKQQPSNVFKKETQHEIVPDPAAVSPIRREQSMSPPPSDKNKVRSASASPSPSPAPLTKAQEELKAKNALEAKIWQDKVEAKKRARRDMFLKSEKEREKKKKEEEEKRIEEESRLAALHEEQRIRLAKEAADKSKELEEERSKLRSQMIRDSLPIGLRYVKLNSDLTKKDIEKYVPLYIFDIDGTDYITDFQVTLLTGCPTKQVTDQFEEDELIISNAVEKSKMWQLFFDLIGIDPRLTSFDFKKQKQDGHELFQNLWIKFIKFDAILPFIKEKYPLTYSYVWEDLSHKTTKVSLSTIEPYNPEDNNHRVVNEEEMEVVIDTNTINRFIPPQLSYRKDSIRAISNSNRPLW